MRSFSLANPPTHCRAVMRCSPQKIAVKVVVGGAGLTGLMCIPLNRAGAASPEDRLLALCPSQVGGEILHGHMLLPSHFQDDKWSCRCGTAHIRLGLVGHTPLLAKANRPPPSPLCSGRPGQVPRPRGLTSMSSGTRLRIQILPHPPEVCASVTPTASSVWTAMVLANPHPSRTDIHPV